MGVAIPVRGGETESAEALELRANLGPQRFAKRRTEGITPAGARWRRDEPARVVRDSRSRRGAPIAQREMQPDAQARVPAGDAHSFLGGGFVNHEAGLSEKPGFMAAFDGFVDFGAATEVVAGDDERFQFGSGPGKLPAPMMICPFFPLLHKA